MEAWLSELRPYEGEPGTSSGWRFAKSSWTLIRTQGSTRLLVIAVGALVTAYSAISILLPISLAPEGGIWPLQLAGEFLLFFAVELGFVAILASADAILDGMPGGPVDAFTEARGVSRGVAGWALVSTAFFAGAVPLSRATGSVGLAFAVFVAWYFAGFFVLPGLLVDGLGVGRALGESLRMLWRQRRQAFGVALWMLTVALMAVIVSTPFFTHAQALQQEGHDWRGALALAFSITTLISLVGMAGQHIASLLIFRSSFEDLPGTTWNGPRRRRAAKVLRVCGGIVALLLVLGATSAIVKGDRKTVNESQEPGANYSIVVSEAGELPNGSPVLYEGRRIGVVLGTSDTDAGLGVRIHVEPGYGPETTPGYFSIEDRAGEPSLVFEPGTAEGSTGQIEAEPS